MRKDIRIAGSGGQGVILLSVILANAFGIHEKLEVAQTQSYGPEARGGACRAEVVVSDQEIDYVKVQHVDYFVAFNKAGFEKYSADIQPDTVIFADSTLLDEAVLSQYPNVYSIEATGVAEELFKPYVANIVMLGFMASKIDRLSLEAAEKALGDAIPEKMLKLNQDALRYGYERGK